MHSFSQAEVAEEYNTFLIDIYATSNLQDLVYSMCKAILSQLMPRGKKALSRFVKKYGLQSPSTVQTSIKALVDRQIVTSDKGVYEVYDKFFSMWLETHMWLSLIPALDLAADFDLGLGQEWRINVLIEMRLS